MEIFEIILTHVSIWAPSIVAILGIATSVMLAINIVKVAIEEFKKDDLIEDLKKELKRSIETNEAIKTDYDAIVDELKKIKDYRKNLR